jgi:hypothetical protein
MVEAKEKALEIFNEHYFYLRCNLMHDEDAKEDAIVCALITVNRIIEALSITPFGSFETEYWQEVRQELESMLDPDARQITH